MNLSGMAAKLGPTWEMIFITNSGGRSIIVSAEGFKGSTGKQLKGYWKLASINSMVPSGLVPFE